MSVLLFFLAAADGAIGPTRWEVQNKTEALSNETTTTATLEADDFVLNMLGDGEKPLLVLRCKEKALVAYVSWPQVLDERWSGYTKVSWRLDDKPIVEDAWAVSDTRTAAGQFRTSDAAKFIKSLSVSSRFIVRMTGQYPQDAAFALGGIADVAPTVLERCGIELAKIK